MELGEGFQDFIRKEIDTEMFYSEIGTATNINESTRTCDFTPLSDKAKRFSIRLQGALSKAEGFVLIPKNNSTVIVTFLNKSTGFVSLTTEIDKVIWDVDSTIINGGALGGLIKIDALLTRINRLETAIDTHMHPTAATGPPSIATPIPSVLPVGQTAKANIEDTKVKH